MIKLTQRQTENLQEMIAAQSFVTDDRDRQMERKLIDYDWLESSEIFPKVLFSLKIDPQA